MKKSLIIKAVIIVIMVVFISVFTNSQLRSILNERNYSYFKVENGIAASRGDAQTISGGLVLIKQKLEKTEKIIEKKDDKKSEKILIKKFNKNKVVLPEKVFIKAKMQSKILYRSIYEVPVYSSQLNIKGSFVFPLKEAEEEENIRLISQRVFLAFEVSDLKGLISVDQSKINEQKVKVKAGSTIKNGLAGFHIEFKDKELIPGKKYSYEIDLKLNGLKEISFIPSAENSEVHLSSDWPDPSFSGNFLPIKRKITKNGFTAVWNTNLLSTNILEKADYCLKHGKCGPYIQKAFGVKIKPSVSSNRILMRSIKYIFLFLCSAYLFLFLFEVLAKLKIHPIQYSCVGAAIALFFLLFLAFSEFLNLSLSYFLATVLSNLLLAIYAGFILKSFKKGLVFGLGILVLFTYLYFAITATQYALISGALFLFGCLATFMILTRKVSWYELSIKSPATLKEEN